MNRSQKDGANFVIGMVLLIVGVEFFFAQACSGVVVEWDGTIHRPDPQNQGAP